MRKSLIAFIVFLGLCSNVFATGVNWSNIWDCDGFEASLMRMDSWDYTGTGEESKTKYFLKTRGEFNELYSSALDIPRQSQLSFDANATGVFGQFFSVIVVDNTKYVANFKENHEDGTLTFKLFLNGNELIDYRFEGCSF